jgi:hypothetical protein
MESDALGWGRASEARELQEVLRLLGLKQLSTSELTRLALNWQHIVKHLPGGRGQGVDNDGIASLKVESYGLRQLHARRVELDDPPQACRVQKTAVEWAA